MLFKRIILHNIRSYAHQEIAFPEGIFLLRGDIGAGKSTILLGIEFALFGIKQKTLTGTTLLRHGTLEGFVELEFMIDEQRIIIRRYLKRAKDTVKQETGYILVNGTKTEGSPIELKSAILEILGYPSELVSKSKDLIYRYTLYTPQEEMKQIITEEPEIRLDLIRRVFGIDKYKRIRENAMILQRELRERRKHLEGFALDIEIKKKQAEELHQELVQCDTLILELQPRIQEREKSLAQAKQKLERLEATLTELIDARKKMAVANARLEEIIMQRNANNAHLKKIDEEYHTLRAQMLNLEPKNMAELIKEQEVLKKAQQQLDQRVQELTKQSAKHEHHKEHAREIVSKITSLSVCPVCEQSVSPQYKESVKFREGNHVKEAEVAIKVLQADYEKLLVEKRGVQESLEALQESLQQARLREHTQSTLGQLEQRRKALEQVQDELKAQVGKINEERSGLQERLEASAGLEDEAKKAKQGVEETQEELHHSMLKLNSAQKERESTEKQWVKVRLEAETKVKAQEQAHQIGTLHDWFENSFIPLMQTLEKSVMVSLYYECNNRFEQWFSMLLEDEAIQARLDDQFTPVIEQNGYQTDVDSLSGGEKTSVALAYRLALNKVISEHVEHIRTKDCIILDEPTDGFSTEQLDKVRDVLHELKMKQVIIVSHEAKIESFVDHVLTVTKEQQESKVVS